MGVYVGIVLMDDARVHFVRLPGPGTLGSSQFYRVNDNLFILAGNAINRLDRCCQAKR